MVLQNWHDRSHHRLDVFFALLYGKNLANDHQEAGEFLFGFLVLVLVVVRLGAVSFLLGRHPSHFLHSFLAVLAKISPYIPSAVSYERNHLSFPSNRLEHAAKQPNYGVCVHMCVSINIIIYIYIYPKSADPKDKPFSLDDAHRVVKR